MMRCCSTKILLFYAVLLLFSMARAQESGYLWPTNASQAMTSSFAESRPGRFHAGIDIKTWGQEGYEVYAIRPGTISRIRVSPFGYGRVLYLTLDTGETAIFAHLQKFNPILEDYVWEQQQRQGQFSVQLFPSVNQFRFQQGDLIGYTGESGVGYPHLHFEIRDQANRPINPFLKGYRVADSVPPTISKIAVSPLDAYSTVAGDWRPLILTPSSGRNYHISSPIRVSGLIGLSVAADDRMDGVTNLFGTFRNQLFVDDQLVFSATYDRFDYEENNQASLDRDFRLFAQSKGVFYKLFRDHGNTLPFYPDKSLLYGTLLFAPDSLDAGARERGVYGELPRGVTVLPIGRHSFKIIVADFWGNETRLTGEFLAEENEHGPEMEPNEFDDEFRSFLRKYSVNLFKDNGPYFKDAKSSPEPETFQASLLAMDSEFYDNYIRLLFKTRKTIQRPITVTGWSFEGKAKKLNLKKMNALEYASSWPLTTRDTSPLMFEISVPQDTGNIYVQKQWLYFTPVQKNQAKKVMTEDGLCNLQFNSESLYRDMFVRSQARIPPAQLDQLVSAIYDLQPEDVPFKGTAVLSLKCLESVSMTNIAIYYLDRFDRWIFMGNRLNTERSEISATIGGLGRFALLRDKEPPLILALSPANGTRLTDRKPLLSASFKDELSGFAGESDLHLLLDGQKTIAEYDPEKSILFFKPRQPLAVGKHVIEIRVRDRGGNLSHKTHQFWID